MPRAIMGLLKFTGTSQFLSLSMTESRMQFSKSYFARL